MIVRVEPGLLELARLIVREHAERAAHLQAHVGHPAHETEDVVELLVVASTAPRGPHTETGASCVLSGLRGREHLVRSEHSACLDGCLVVRGLGAVRAVLRAGPGLDGEQRAYLDFAVSWYLPGGLTRPGRSAPSKECRRAAEPRPGPVRAHVEHAE